MKLTQNQINDIISWDIKNWYKALDFWEKNVKWDNVKDCLELGGREGGLSLWLSLKGKKVICSDLDNVENTAVILHKKYDIQEFVKYENIDAMNIPYENHFDLIVFKSIIGGIGKNNNLEFQKKVFDEIHKALKPGGILIFAENTIASVLHQILRKKFISWANLWRYISLDEMKFFMERFSSYEIKTSGFLGAFGRTESQRNILAFFDLVLFNKIIPSKWKYIVYGFAIK